MAAAETRLHTTCGPAAKCGPDPHLVLDTRTAHARQREFTACGSSAEASICRRTARSVARCFNSRRAASKVRKGYCRTLDTKTKMFCEVVHVAYLLQNEAVLYAQSS